MNQRNNIVDSNTLSTLEFHTKLSKEERKRHINWFNKQNIEFQIMIFDEQKNQFFKLTIAHKLFKLTCFNLTLLKHFNSVFNLFKITHYLIPFVVEFKATLRTSRCILPLA